MDPSAVAFVARTVICLRDELAPGACGLLLRQMRDIPTVDVFRTRVVEYVLVLPSPDLSPVLDDLWLAFFIRHNQQILQGDAVRCVFRDLDYFRGMFHVRFFLEQIIGSQGHCFVEMELHFIAASHGENGLTVFFVRLMSLCRSEQGGYDADVK